MGKHVSGRGAAPFTRILPGGRGCIMWFLMKYSHRWVYSLSRCAFSESMAVFCLKWESWVYTPSGVYVRSSTSADPSTDTAIRNMIKECLANPFKYQNLSDRWILVLKGVDEAKHIIRKHHFGTESRDDPCSLIYRGLKGSSQIHQYFFISLLIAFFRQNPWK